MALLWRTLCALGFVLLALAITWPLPLHLATHLTGMPSGDTGVYVWNLWVFRHELLQHGHWPFTTDLLFAYTQHTDLSTHNYTVFADLLALPLVGWLGVVRTFNVIYVLLVASSGYAAFLLIRRLTGKAVESWIAAAVFAASPYLVARGTAHFSLVAAAPLPLFVLFALRALEGRRIADAVMAGVAMGWAGYCDVYYTVYCVLIGAFLWADRLWAVEPQPEAFRAGTGWKIVNALLIAGALVVGWRLWHGEFSTTVFGQTLSFRTLYTPVLALTLLVLVRQQMRWRLRFRGRSSTSIGADLKLVAAVLASAAVVLSPVVVQLAIELTQGHFPSPPIGWRSSPPGLDAVDLVMPNPHHPWFGAGTMRWIARRGPLAYPEFVVSIPIAALAAIAVALRRARGAIPRVWIAFTVVFALLALGPFVQVAGVNTFVPGPWYVLRFVPVVGLARSPARFGIVVTLGASILLGFALVALRKRWKGRSAMALAIVAALLALELLPVPRPLYEARVPSVYSRIANDTDDSLRVLELPGGVRDGTSSIGDFNAASEFFQTVHRKPLIGGYLSRVPEWRKEAALRVPVLAVLFRLSERQPVAPELVSQARATRDAFLSQACIGYVVVDRQRASPQLRRMAIDLLGLKLVDEGEDRELYVPSSKSAGC